LNGSVDVLGVPISPRSMADSLKQVKTWLQEKGSCRTVTFSNAHMLALAAGDGEFRGMLRSMDMNCADGVPVFLVANSLKHPDKVGHVPGPDFMPCLVREMVGSGRSHFIFGGGPGVAEAAAESLQKQFPGADFSGVFSPPYRSFSDQDIAKHCEMIRMSGADIVWVALGCPKQERWLYRARPLLPGKVLLAVGQAVDIQAGVVERAPRIHRKLGMEWFYRLTKDPRRLWRRYLIYNSQFLYFVLRDVVRGKRSIANWERP
jgi:N-acetylglucosaminyldiphosphoundecaprenol N-acetyl-beta-D-mannosaminyltransferase